MAIAAVEYGQAPDQAEAQIATLGGTPGRNAAASARRRGRPTAARLGDVPDRTAWPGQRGKLDPLEVRAVIAGGNLRKPQALPSSIVAFGRARRHAGAGIELFQANAATCAFLDGLRSAINSSG